MEAFKSFLNIVILLGALQGFISSILLFKYKHNRSNKFLAWIILFISLACLDVYLFQAIDNDVQSTTYHLIRAILPLGIYMPIFPLVYFYTKSLFNTEFKLNKSHKIQLYTVLFDIVPYLVALVYVVGVLMKSISSQNSDGYGNFIYIWNTYGDIPRWLSLMFYLRLTYKEISANNDSKVYKATISWVRQLFKAFLMFSILWLFYLIPYVIPSASEQLVKVLGWFPIYIPLSVLVYWLGIKGYIIGTKVNAHRAPKTKLEPHIIEKTVLKLNNAMQNDKLYLDASLKLNDIVAYVKIPQKTISAVLNQHLQKSFNEYVNEYRIEEVKSKLINPDFDHLTITGVALESGFNSQATFQRTFKKIVKQSPKAFRLNCTNTSINSSQI
ncbi:helix-turn-helix domain-containing protein [Seonamhaeicola marinus]|uniref:Helix-turn-helix transcriptional regulator n=1 Tax=Seonamhaeicola marinus TaxID=1912246 RepID=A0A5D0IVB9_9FLAO|nr:helix-turn-helix transcriptional regulator [Seonamhaeicola marinus]TYA86780.1 helix-turn-helix transcriptional regulator [Seonamhaeicola marinus]